MSITIIIIILTFVHTIIDKFVLNNDIEIKENEKYSIFYKIIKSKFSLAILLICLLTFQIISEFGSNEAIKIRDTKASTAYDTLYASHNTIKKVNSSVDSLLSNIASTLKITKNELLLISSVNNDLEKVRVGINNSIDEFKSIKEQYEKQIEIEKEKIKEARPKLEVAYSKRYIDSISFRYQFELYNSGIRLADSIIYHSLVIFADSNLILKDICLYKTNIDEANILSISHTNSKIFNSDEIEIKKLSAFARAYLLISYKYKDNITQLFKNEFIIFGASPLETGNKQLGINIKDYEEKGIRLHLAKNKKLYDIFYK